MNIFKKFLSSGTMIFMNCELFDYLNVFTDMDPRTWLFTNILIGVLAVTFLLMIFDIAFVFSFNAIFKKHQKALTILLNIKYDNLQEIQKKLEELDVEFSEKTQKLWINVQRNDFNEPGSKKFISGMNNLTYLFNAFSASINQKKLCEKDEDLSLLVQNIKDSDKEFRNILTMYNADCLGYNYWISFYPTRFIWKMFRFKPRNIIEL